MAKKPEFKLYRICNRENGKAFVGFSALDKPKFANLGAFFRSPETIRRHLKTLTHRHSIEVYNNKLYSNQLEEIPNEYRKYYVEVYSVVALSMHTEEAAKYLGKQNQQEVKSEAVN